MIDIHCHILPAIDDGPAEMRESVEMARIAAMDGIRTIVASPHFLYGGRPAMDDLRQAVLSLRKGLEDGAVRIEVVEGADVKLTYELLDGMRKCDMPTINGSRYFLLELPEVVPPNLDNFLHTAHISGFVPIITHPERNYTFLTSPRKVDRLRDAGALLQVTAMSVTGEFGMEIQDLSLMLIKKGLVDFVASDAHGAGYRRPVLSDAYRRLSRLMKGTRLRKIFFENPEAVLENGEIAAG